MRKLAHMTETIILDAVRGVVPEWTLADRLRKAREVAGLSQARLAERIGVTRDIVTNYESGRTPARRPMLVTWAVATGVDLRWLEAGGSPTPPRDHVTGRLMVRVHPQEHATRRFRLVQPPILRSEIIENSQAA